MMYETDRKHFFPELCKSSVCKNIIKTDKQNKLLDMKRYLVSLQYFIMINMDKI